MAYWRSTHYTLSDEIILDHLERSQCALCVLCARFIGYAVAREVTCDDREIINQIIIYMLR